MSDGRYQPCPFFGCRLSFTGEDWYRELDDHLDADHNCSIDDVPLNF